MATNKGGRPKKPVGEKAEQFSLRLTPKLRFGLEALARFQGRTMSQVIEWGLRMSLQSVTPGKIIRRTLDEIVELAWSRRMIWQRAFEMYKANPGLVSFEVNHACGLIESCREQKELRELRELAYEVHNDGANIEARRRYRRASSLFEWVIQFIWDELLDDAEKLRIAPRLGRQRLLAATKFWHEVFPRFDESPPFGTPIDTLLIEIHDRIMKFQETDGLENPPQPPYAPAPIADSEAESEAQAALQADNADRFSAK